MDSRIVIGRSTLDEHLPPEALAYKLQDPQWCLKKATEVGPACLGLIEKLFAHQVLDNLRAAQGVVRLGSRYGKSRLEAACERALLFDSPRYRTVKTILERGQDQLPANSRRHPCPPFTAARAVSSAIPPLSSTNQHKVTI